MHTLGSIRAGIVTVTFVLAAGCATSPAAQSARQPIAPATTPATPAPQAAMAQPAGNPVQPAATPITALSLYGQFPQEIPGRSSPLDSPDNLRQVSFTAEGSDFDPDIDPTGTWMVYASTQHRPSADIYLKRVDGTAVTQLVNDPANDVMPVFSPDGKRIAFASDRSGNWDLYLVDVQGGRAVQLTSDPTHELHPSFSPDGRQLVYSTYGGQSGQWELVVMDLENPATKRYIGSGLFPHWSPVDNRILFQRARERGTRWFSIWTIELVGGEGLRPTEIAASTNAAAITPHWSPDGRFIVFSTVLNPDVSTTAEGAMAGARPTQADLWIVAADGSSRANLTNGQFANLEPVWGRDGSIYFVSNRGKDAVDNIWALRPQQAVQMAQEKTTAQPGSAKAPTDKPAPGAPGAAAPGTAATAAVPTP